MKKIDWNNVEEVKDFEKLPAGGYVCGITSVEDKEKEEYLILEFDIAEGEYKNYYRNLYESKGFWAAKFLKSYKEKARGFFKKMLVAFEKSNSGFKFDNDEKTLKRKLIGLVVGYEQYRNQAGEVKERITVTDFLPVEDIRAGKFNVPTLKKLAEEEETNEGFTSVDEEDGDLPF
jgi:hypothetical protein